jgi:endothelin-converting enzyme
MPTMLESEYPAEKARGLELPLTAGHVKAAGYPMAGLQTGSHSRRRTAKPFVTFVSYVLGLLAIFYTLDHWRLIPDMHRESQLAPAPDSAISGISKSEPVKVDDSLCTSSACIHAASEILYNLSPNYKNINPCEDFEEYVCGGWRERHDLRPDQGGAFTGTLMVERSQSLLRHILETEYPHDSAHSYFSPMQLLSAAKSADERNFDKMKEAYDACMDTDAIKQAGDAPLKEFLATFDITKPSTQVEKDVELQGVLRWLSYHGVTGLVSLFAGADDTDPESVVVAVSPPGYIGLPSKERYEDADLVKKYTAVMSEVLGSLESGESTLADKSEAIVSLEKKLAAASPSNEDAQNVTKYYNPMALDDAAKLCPQIDLVAMVKAYASQTGTKVSRVIVTWPSYLEDLNKIIKETDVDVLQAYLTWKSVQSLSGFIEADSVTPYQRFAKELAGQDPDAVPERWRTCVRWVDSSLGWVLSRFFIEKAFSAAAKELGERMIADIKTQFIATLKETEWMEEEVKELAIKKVRAIIVKVGYPDKSPNITDPSSLAKYYEKLTMSSSFFNNTMNTRIFDVSTMWNTLGKPVDKNEWGMTAPTVNAYYNPPGSEIVFPAGILQPPVFDANIPEYMGYGAFASVAGHELSHAFDSTGRHYDEHGNLTDWWTEKTIAAFEDRAQCFVDQYSKFSITGPDGKEYHVNGRLTLGENIADAGGVNAAFKAWKLRAAETPNKNMAGLEDFTQDQLFFSKYALLYRFNANSIVSYANWWCGVTRPQQALNLIYTDPHSPKEARILGTMSNAPAFKKSFNCPVKEPTCKLW